MACHGTEVVLFISSCPSGYRLTANRVMLCARNQFILENMRDLTIYEYNEILEGSGSSGIVKEKRIVPLPAREWYDTYFRLDETMHDLFSNW